MQSLTLIGSVFTKEEFKFIKRQICKGDQLSEVKLRGSEFMYSPEVIKYEKDKIKSKLREETIDMSMIIIDEKPIKEIGDILFYTMGLQGKREGLI